MRGEVYRLAAPRDARGHEQSGRRYAVVVLATRYAHLSQWLVVPTSTRATATLFRPRIEVAQTPALALCDALVAVDPGQRLGDLVDYLPLSSVAAIDLALSNLLDLNAN